jgi:endonuclease YncB( thermonuclease family)
MIKTMHIVRRFCVLLILVLVAPEAYGQVRLAGKVVEVIDGRTVVIETNAGKLTARLQYIESPEPEQPLYTVVRDHLASLALNKVVEFRPLRLDDKITVGRVEMGGVDLGLQLVRNGAAWHQPVELSGQPQNEASEYSGNQLSAKTEKRGVWSIPGLKTPWQIRAEKEAELDRLEKERKGSKPATFAVNQYQTVNRQGTADPINWGASRRMELNAWGDVFAGVGKETRGLQTHSDPQRRFDAIYTSAVFVDLNGGKIERRMECRLIFAYLNLPDGRRQTLYAIGFRTLADDYYFSKQKSRLTFTADKRNLVIGQPSYGKRGAGAIGTEEIFYYEPSKPQVRSIGNAKNLEIRIDGMLGTVSEDDRALFKELAATAN